MIEKMAAPKPAHFLWRMDSAVARQKPACEGN
jgi:hypothetical protein